MDSDKMLHETEIYRKGRKIGIVNAEGTFICATGYQVIDDKIVEMAIPDCAKEPRRAPGSGYSPERGSQQPVRPPQGGSGGFPKPPDYVERLGYFPCPRVGQSDSAAPSHKLPPYYDSDKPPHPRVVWIGKIGHEVFRIVDRRAPREDKTKDVRVRLEQARGRDAMDVKSWGGVHESARSLAMRALTQAFAEVLVRLPLEFDIGHPMFCELNLAVAEGRDPRGCDCGRPADPPFLVTHYTERPQVYNAEYLCGCRASGPAPLPGMCPNHGARSET